MSLYHKQETIYQGRDNEVVVYQDMLKLEKITWKKIHALLVNEFCFIVVDALL